MKLKDRLSLFIENKGITTREFERICGLSNGYVRGIREGMGAEKLDIVLQKFPDLDREWLLYGEGEMLKPDSPETQNEVVGDFEEEKFYTYKLPIAAVGGSLDGWGVTESIMPWQCERVVSPVRGVDWAIPVVGDSMAPDYPNGSTVYVKKINPSSFINWGQVFVLDTENGNILKEVQPCEDDDSCIECHSLNPNPKYKPFRVPKVDIRGMYRVVACISLRG